jgi:hypothetical protein
MVYDGGVDLPLAPRTASYDTSIVNSICRFMARRL